MTPTFRLSEERFYETFALKFAIWTLITTLFILLVMVT